MALTRDQIEELRLEMKRPDHRSMAEVAIDLGTTKGVIAGAFARAGIKIGGNDVRARLEGQRDRIEALAAMNVSAWGIARELGCNDGTIRSFCDRHGIALHVRVPQPRPKDKAIRESMKGLFGKQRPLSQRDRDEMRRLADEAIAAGRITRCPPGHAIGTKTFFREEYA
ncbi:hypothetical protein [Devosia salina]|uniref:Helix-turn-helix domain-containing protein n=1 Tax=Devosia salina TaxID=2860336 RepID=A0ABX8WNQ9_9HYPH|nr:hypothetical protein [Devosia salina]QYO78397.1 hypothetical protein K1X15_07580 [Devosia salina]